MAKKKFKAAPGSGITDGQAEKYGPEVERLLNENGELLTPQDIVDAASDPNSPLHGYFDWGKKEASRNFKMDEGRHLLRGVVRVVMKPGAKKEKKRLFVSVVHKEDDNPFSTPVQNYVSGEKAFNDDEIRQQIVERELFKLRSWERRFAFVGELFEVREGIKELIGKSRWGEAVMASFELVG